MCVWVLTLFYSIKGTVAQDALINALKTNQIYAAGLDVSGFGNELTNLVRNQV